MSYLACSFACCGICDHDRERERTRIFVLAALLMAGTILTACDLTALSTLTTMARTLAPNDSQGPPSTPINAADSIWLAARGAVRKAMDDSVENRSSSS